jgi:hypothetical protein
MMNTVYIESKNLKIANNDLKGKVEALEKTKAENLESISQWQYLFQYYQSLVMKFSKDLDFLEPPKFDANSDISLLQQDDLMKRIRSIEKNRALMDIPI